MNYSQDAQSLCQSCHNELVHYFENSTHAKEGLLCIDCHLIVSETEIGDGHGQRMHTFSVDMGTCSKCHIDNLHQGGVDMGIDDEAVLQAGLLPGFETNTLDQPSAVSPIGFAIFFLSQVFSRSFTAYPAKRHLFKGLGRR